MITDEMIRQYDARIPRYTSYPTAIELTRCEDDRLVQDALRAAAPHPLALYVHLPFCRSMCWFCACNKIVTTDHAICKEYLLDLKQELALLHRACDSKPIVESVHLGGGSPSFLTSDELSTLCELLNEACSGFDSATKSIELDPRTTDQLQVAALRSNGFTRASLGVQDFDPHVQELVHRVQSYELVRDTTRIVREAGFKGVNFDLIYGLPGQNEQTMQKTIEQVISLTPDRIALYGYAHVQWKAKGQKLLDKHILPSPTQRVQLFSIAEQALVDAGYIPVGLDHFALPTDELIEHAESGTLHRNFMGYTTTAEDVLGIGVSSISDVYGVLYQNHTDLKEYSASVRAGRLPIGKLKPRNADDRVRSILIERVMCEGELDVARLPEDIREQASAVIAEAEPQLLQMQRDGIISLDDGVIRATYPGRYFLRAISSAFDAYLDKAKGESFSKAL